MSVRDNIKKQKAEEAQAQEVELTEEQKAAEAELDSKRGARAAVKSTVAKANRPKREYFKWVKMWISFLVSMTMKDRGKIPDNIGDRILISSNLYITKLYMTTIVQIHELGPKTPVTMMGTRSISMTQRTLVFVQESRCGKIMLTQKALLVR